MQHLHYATLAIYNTCNIQHLQYATLAISNTCNSRHLQFTTLAICNTWNLQHLKFATLAIWNTCNLQHLQFATLAIWNTCNLQQLQFEEYPHLHCGSEEGPTLWVGLSLTWGVRGGECPVIPPVHWKGVALPRQRSSRTLKTLSNFKGFYSVFLQLRDFFW